MLHEQVCVSAQVARGKPNATQMPASRDTLYPTARRDTLYTSSRIIKQFDALSQLKPDFCISNNINLYLTNVLSERKSSNGRKIARIAPISTIFRPIESQRHDRFPKTFSSEQNERKVFEKLFAVVAAVVVVGRFREDTNRWLTFKDN